MNKHSHPVQILLVQDNPDYVSVLRRRLSNEKDFAAEVEYVMTLRDALKRLAGGDIDLVVLELSLPDSEGLKTFQKVQLQAPSVPVVLLTTTDKELEALKAVRLGAQDYLLKSELDGKFLPRVIRHAIERQRMTARLMAMSLIDDLTEVYNRRGFYLLAEQQMKLSARSKGRLLLILADVDGLKQINDTFGHPQGDLALVNTAKILKKAFRSSDIVARLGGDEFGIIAVEASEMHKEVILKRVDKAIQNYNVGAKLPFSLSISLGFAQFDPEQTVFLEQLVEQADQNLYESKKQKQRH